MFLIQIVILDYSNIRSFKNLVSFNQERSLDVIIHHIIRPSSTIPAYRAAFLRITLRAREMASRTISDHTVTYVFARLTQTTFFIV